MTTYILILTLVFKSGYAGLGGVSTIEDLTLDQCNRIGSKWLKRHDGNELWFTDNGSNYMCIPMEVTA